MESEAGNPAIELGRIPDLKTHMPHPRIPHAGLQGSLRLSEHEFVVPHGKHDPVLADAPQDGEPEHIPIEGLRGRKSTDP
jgi:hypothetical protein